MIAQTVRRYLSQHRFDHKPVSLTVTADDTCAELRLQYAASGELGAVVDRLVETLRPRFRYTIGGSFHHDKRYSPDQLIHQSADERIRMVVDGMIHPMSADEIAHAAAVKTQRVYSVMKILRNQGYVVVTRPSPYRDAYALTPAGRSNNSLVNPHPIDQIRRFLATQPEAVTVHQISTALGVGVRGVYVHIRELKSLGFVEVTIREHQPRLIRATGQGRAGTDLLKPRIVDRVRQFLLSKQDPVHIGEIAAALEIPESEVHRSLAALLQSRYVAKTTDGDRTRSLLYTRTSQPQSSPDISGHGYGTDRVRVVLLSNDTPMTVAQIATKTNLHRERARHVLRDLTANGLAVAIDPGHGQKPWTYAIPRLDRGSLEADGDAGRMLQAFRYWGDEGATANQVAASLELPFTYSDQLMKELVRLRLIAGIGKPSRQRRFRISSAGRRFTRGFPPARPVVIRNGRRQEPTWLPIWGL